MINFCRVWATEDHEMEPCITFQLEHRFLKKKIWCGVVLLIAYSPLPANCRLKLGPRPGPGPLHVCKGLQALGVHHTTSWDTDRLWPHYSTSAPSGNQVDGLPLVLHTRAVVVAVQKTPRFSVTFQKSWRCLINELHILMKSVLSRFEITLKW